MHLFCVLLQPHHGLVDVFVLLTCHWHPCLLRLISRTSSGWLISIRFRLSRMHYYFPGKNWLRHLPMVMLMVRPAPKRVSHCTTVFSHKYPTIACSCSDFSKKTTGEHFIEMACPLSHWSPFYWVFSTVQNDMGSVCIWPSSVSPAALLSIPFNFCPLGFGVHTTTSSPK